MSKGRKLLRIQTFLAIAGCATIAIIPLSLTALKLAFLCCLAAAWIGLTLLAWNRPWRRLALLAVPLLATALILLPGRGVDPTELRDRYLRNLTRFEGTTYFWGGEGRLGIDCSGLPRRAFRDALLAYGIRHASGPSLRAYLEQWWYDASARALGKGYRDYTVPLGISGKISEMDATNLLPGDLAVTRDGVHILAYLGDDRWIQADPGIGTVATLNGRTADNSYFRAPVTLHRWRLLRTP